MNHQRMAREKRTVAAMIDLYCREQHGTRDGLCSECEALTAYANQRLQNCPFQQGKTTCARCPVHCYKPGMRDRIRAVMRCAGPRMVCRHPIMTIQHMVDGLRKEPVRVHKARTAQANVVKKAEG